MDGVAHWHSYATFRAFLSVTGQGPLLPIVRKYVVWAVVAALGASLIIASLLVAVSGGKKGTLTTEPVCLLCPAQFT